MTRTTIYTDGACLKNPGGAGGYAALVLVGLWRSQVVGGFRNTTSNRMEIMAAIAGLDTLKEPHVVTVRCDSEYVVNSIRLGWAKSWRHRGWVKSDGEPAKNADLWARLLDLCDRHTVTFEWLRGHSGQSENELCDWLAYSAARESDLPEDEGYTQCEMVREPEMKAELPTILPIPRRRKARKQRQPSAFQSPTSTR